MPPRSGIFDWGASKKGRSDSLDFRGEYGALLGETAVGTACSGVVGVLPPVGALPFSVIEYVPSAFSTLVLVVGPATPSGVSGLVVGGALRERALRVNSCAALARTALWAAPPSAPPTPCGSRLAPMPASRLMKLGLLNSRCKLLCPGVVLSVIGVVFILAPLPRSV